MPQRAWSTGVSLLVFAAALGAVLTVHQRAAPEPWSEPELEIIRSLQLAELPSLQEDTANAVADHPAAQSLGHRLFFDARLSATGTVSCSTCHQPERRFADGLNRAVGVGLGDFNSMSLVGVAYSPWHFWNGRKDSLWAQATSPLESPIEHGATRAGISRLIAEDAVYRRDYEALFGALPELPSTEPSAVADERAVTEVFVNAAKAIAAYEQLLLPAESRFDRYVESLKRGQPPPGAGFSRVEIEGLRLFIGKAQCTNCHNGPLFTNHEFHNTGVLPAPIALPSKGRAAALELVRNDPFNCLGPYSDAAAKPCQELRFMRTGVELIGAHKVPSLRNLKGTEPYMHAGQIRTIMEVLNHYNRAQNSIIGHNEAKPLNLLPYELKRLEAFLHSLDAPLATEPHWLLPPGQASRQPTPDRTPSG